VDPTVLLFTLAMTLLTAIVFGLGPAMKTARTSANDLGRIGQRVAGDRGVRRGHQALVVGELALAQALLVGAGLLLVSFVHATRIDLGFAQHDRVLAEVNLTPAYIQPLGKDGHIDPSKKVRFINTVLDRVRSAPACARWRPHRRRRSPARRIAACASRGIRCCRRISSPTPISS
jgi:hypothetical protein